jgi:hypothetical protein
MVDVIIDGEVAYCLPDCTCCTACHKLIDEEPFIFDGNDWHLQKGPNGVEK